MLVVPRRSSRRLDFDQRNLGMLTFRRIIIYMFIG